MSQEIIIYCVDNDASSRVILSEVLNEYHVQSFETGEDCIQSIEQKKPDLILMDMMLSGISGLDICQQIRSNSDYYGIPVIFLSQNYSLEARLKCYAAGGDDYIVKPYDQGELVAKVKATLQRKHLLDKAQAQIKDAAYKSSELTDTLGEMGAVVYFLQSIITVRSYDTLAKKVIEAHESLGLQIAIEFMVNDTVLNFSSNNIENPLEESAFEYVRNKGRLHDFGEHTAVNFPTISIIVRNMPINNPELHGRIRDHIAIIAQGAHSKNEMLSNELMVQQKYKQMTEGLSQIENNLIEIDFSMRNFDDKDNTETIESIHLKLNTIIAEVNEILADSNIDELIEDESEQEEVEAVMFF